MCGPYMCVMKRTISVCLEMSYSSEDSMLFLCHLLALM